MKDMILAKAYFVENLRVWTREGQKVECLRRTGFMKRISSLSNLRLARTFYVMYRVLVMKKN